MSSSSPFKTSKLEFFKGLFDIVKQRRMFHKMSQSDGIKKLVSIYNGSSSDDKMALRKLYSEHLQHNRSIAHVSDVIHRLRESVAPKEHDLESYNWKRDVTLLSFRHLAEVYPDEVKDYNKGSTMDIYPIETSPQNQYLSFLSEDYLFLRLTSDTFSVPYGKMIYMANESNRNGLKRSCERGLYLKSFDCFDYVFSRARESKRGSIKRKYTGHRNYSFVTLKRRNALELSFAKKEEYDLMAETLKLLVTETESDLELRRFALQIHLASKQH